MTVHDDGTLSNDRIKELEDAVNALIGGGLPAWFTTTDAPNTATLQADVAQTDPLLDLQDSGSNSLFAVTPVATGVEVAALAASGTARFDVSVGAGNAGVLVRGWSGQTDVLFDIQDSTTNSVFAASGDNKLGFFSVANSPVARPTGVAVSSAGIHAALVTLGLITA